MRRIWVGIHSAQEDERGELVPMFREAEAARVTDGAGLVAGEMITIWMDPIELEATAEYDPPSDLWIARPLLGTTRALHITAELRVWIEAEIRRRTGPSP